MCFPARGFSFTLRDFDRLVVVKGRVLMVAAIADCTNKMTMATTKRQEERRT
jgi:hypothetical protein